MKGRGDGWTDRRGFAPACAAIPVGHRPGAVDPGGERGQGQGGPDRGPAGQPRGVQPGGGRPIRWPCWRSRRRPGCLSWCRSAGAGCWCPRSPTTGARPCRWPAIWLGRRYPGLAVQACGDAHLSNFGIFGSPERRLVFDVNDFDETLPGPWEWDVKRLAASLEVAGRDNGFTHQAAPGHRPGGGRPVPAGDTELRGDDPPRDLVRPRGCGPVAGRSRCPSSPGASADDGQGHGPGADQGQHAGGGQAHPRRGRAPANPFRSAAAGAGRRADSRQ